MNILTKNQSTALESFRGLSSLAVLVCHFFQVFLARFYPQYFVYDVVIAHSSVMIFFVMSGYLIGMSIQNNVIKNSYFNLSEYASSRFNRIYPPLVFTSLLCIILFLLAPYVFESGSSNFASNDSYLSNKSLTITAKELLSSLTFTNGFLPVTVRFNSPLWSLPFEVWYYIAFGLLATRKVGLIFVSILLFSVISIANERFFYYSLVWIAGFIASYINANKLIIKLIAVILFLYFGYLAANNAYIFIGNGQDLEPYKLSFGLFFAFFVLLAIKTYDIKFNVLPFTARFSYTLYIIHFPIMLFFIGCYESLIISSPKLSALIGGCSMIATIIIAYWSSKVFENKKAIDKLFNKTIQSKRKES